MMARSNKKLRNKAKLLKNIDDFKVVADKTTKKEYINSSGIVDKLEKCNIKEQITLETGIEYPLDLWFLLSEYIKPEDIGKFASICKSSNYVTRTGKFWFHLYKRYYKPLPHLPERLRPECMVLLRGLRACVIRTLHLTYFSSLDRVNKNPYLEQEEPHSLVKRRCCLMWHKKGESHWYFFFKLKKIVNSHNNAKKENVSINSNDEFNVHSMLEEVSINTENNCRVLRVTCINYGMIPLVNGLILQSVKMDLSPGFKHHRLHLNFSSNCSSKIPTHVVILSGVVDCKVLDWWHPCYPHHDRAIDVSLPSVEFWDF
ncbi:transmembrane protein 183A [Microplitis demolitor]|uniref:transmembrane protein 183A n=1 Tax=Microplitis demolitor TaxID=69319 RepID=UPI0004CCA19C|nr:transmembrane protein 183A [Microplitis demolitor]